MLLCWRKLKRTMGATSVLLALFFHFGWCCGCSFPDYMYGTLESWRILSAEPNLPLHHDYRKVSFWHDTIRVEYMMGQQSLFSYTIKCKTIAGNDTYVVQKDMQGYSAQYTCLQFLPRDTNVVQWRMSSWQHYQGDVSCNKDDLVLSEAPLVYYYLRSDYWREDRNRGKDYVPCPLEGGYIMKWQDSSGKYPCNQVLSTLKLENECSPGEGLLFNGLGNGCELPHRKLRKKYFCLSSWQEEGQTYMLLHNSESDLEAPCVRYEMGHSEHFDIHFFMDGVCDQTPAMVRSKDYITVHLEKHRVPNICTDETPLCRSLEPDDCDDVTTKVCRGTCKACPQDQQEQWSYFHLPDEYQDNWIKFTDFIGRESVIIKGREFTIPSLGTFMSFGQSECLAEKYRRKLHGLEGSDVQEFVLLSFRDNGCSPRVSTLMLKPRSEMVASFRLSYPIPVKVYIDESMNMADGSQRKSLGFWGYMCSFVGYKEEPPPVGNIFRPYPWSWYNMVRFDKQPVSGHCVLPINGQRFNVTFGANVLRHARRECKGFIRTEAYAEVNKMDITLEGCYTDNGTYMELRRKEHFSFPCVAQFGDYDLVHKNGSRFIIADTYQSRDLTSEQYICWVIMLDVVYWYPISQCDRLGPRLKENIKNTPPLAKFHFEPQSYVLVSDSVPKFNHFHGNIIMVLGFFAARFIL